MIWLRRAACVAIISAVLPAGRGSAGRRGGGASRPRVDGGHRRAEAVRDRRHEVVLLVFEPALAGDVAERVDDAVGDLDGYERQPGGRPSSSRGSVTERAAAPPRRRECVSRACAVRDDVGDRLAEDASRRTRSRACGSGSSNCTMPSRSTNGTPSPRASAPAEPPAPARPRRRAPRLRPTRGAAALAADARSGPRSPSARPGRRRPRGARRSTHRDLSSAGRLPQRAPRP